MPTPVTDPGFADPATALAHFERRLLLETDCSDVHEALKAGADFVLVDVRGPQAFARGHVPGAANIPHRTMTAERMASFPPDTVFVVYCAGPHCNGANKGAVRLARLGFRVKEMIGGITGWLDEDFALERESRAA
jgi:rhodanese-related sulfurtransferase